VKNSGLEEFKIYNGTAWISQRPASGVATFDFFRDGSSVALWQFDGTANDTGGQYNGTWSGTAQYGTGKFGQCAYFDGSNRVTNFGLSSTTGDWTWSLWLKPTQFSVYNEFFSVNGSTNIGSNGQILINNGVVDWWANFLRDNTSLSLNTWVHIAVTKIGTNFVYYRDGVAKDTATTSNNVFDLSALSLGADAGDEVYRGYMDQVRIFNRGLSQNEILQLVNES
jgi:arabinan endo-1,5-alpha-L-arabinosidase